MTRTITFSLAAASIIAFALPLAANADTGAYVGASFGNARLDDYFEGFGFDTEANSYRFFGGIQLGDTFGIEAGYLNFAEFSNRVDLGGNGWTLGATLALPLSENLSLFGKGGMFFWDADISIDGFSIDRRGETNPYYGGGLKADLGEHFSLTGDWTIYKFDTLETDVISLGFNYRF